MGKKKKNSAAQPFYIDFCPPPDTKLGRRQSGQGGNELLLKATAPRKLGKGQDSIAGSGATIMDLTAGFGQDSMMMALGGASKVPMVERDPIVSLLLDDALRRLKLLSEQNDTNLIDDGSRRRAS